MLGALRTVFDVGVKGQAMRLVGLAEAYKERTVGEIKQQVAAAAVTAAVAAAALAFTLMAIVIGLAALYYWVALWYGTMAGLGAAGGTAVVLALLSFAIVAARASGGSGADAEAKLARIKADARAAVRETRASIADLGKSAEKNASGLGKEAYDAATGIMRNGSREAVLATLAATVVIGILVGRRS